MPMKKPNHPGDLIRDCLDELKINVTDGAKALGVTRATLSHGAKWSESVLVNQTCR